MPLNSKNVRKVSFDILYDVFFNEKMLNTVLNEKFLNGNYNEIDKAFVKRECSGAIENLEQIDTLINKYSKVKTKKLDRDILLALRIAVYEFVYMDKVPTFATINEIVNIVKKSKNSRFSGFVNAVLRSIDREEKINKESVDKINIGQGTKKCYFRIYNDNEEMVLKELSSKKIFYHKYNGNLDFNYSKVYYVGKYKEILQLESFKNGNILIEDVSSVYLTDKLASFIKEHKKQLSDDRNYISEIKLLDTCASPGGKIMSLIDLVRNDYQTIYAEARDVSEEKIQKINDNIQRLKISSLTTKIKDATVYDELDDSKYDVVLLDVPCTGLGVLDKKPDIKLRYTMEKRDSLVKIQRKILESCKNYVKKGGIISYSTCTETKDENEDNIKYFISNNSNFEVIFEKKIYRNDENEADGFYMCFMRRK